MSRRAILAAVWLLSIGVLGEGARAATLTVPWAQPSEFDTWKRGGVTYARATELFTLLGGNVDPGPYPADISVTLRGHRLLFYHESPFVRYDSEVFNLSAPVYLHMGDAAVPVATIAELISEIISLGQQWDSEAQTLRFFPVGGEVGPVSAELKRNGMILNIETGGPATYEVYQSMDDWLTITLPGARRGKIQFDRRPFGRYIQEFKSYEFEESVQLSFRLRPGRVRWEHRMATDPYRIEITLIDTTFALDSADAPGLLSPAATAAGDGVETDPIDVIVVDAGHGGEDLGAVGPRGTREKDVVLGIARYLAKLLEADPDFKVILTRRDDTFVPLRRRAEIANEANADLFVSIHANSAARRAARGFETFFLSAARSDEARATEQLENASLRFEEAAEIPGTDDLDFILTDLLQNQFLNESAQLAQSIQSAFGRAFSGPDRGVNQAGFVVLYQAYMPAVLVETGFLSNADEEVWLARSSTQQRIAETLYESIVAFRDRYEEKP